MGKPFYKAEELLKRGFVDSHRRMFIIKRDTMLIIINVRRILKAPLFSSELNWDYPVVLARRLCEGSRVAFVFRA